MAPRLVLSLGDGPAPWVARVAPNPVCPPESIAILGYRDPDELEDLAVQLAVNRDRGVLAVDRPTIQHYGAAVMAGRALDHLRATTDRFWLHVDLDVLDERVFPATDYLMPDGLDWVELVDLLRPIAHDDGLIGWSIACYNPEKDPDGTGGRAIVAALWRLFGTGAD